MICILLHMLKVRLGASKKNRDQCLINSFEKQEVETHGRETSNVNPNSLGRSHMILIILKQEN